MPSSIFPDQGALNVFFASRHHPIFGTKLDSEKPPTSLTQERPTFPAWSAVEDIKSKAEAAGNAAGKDFQLASNKVQAKTGHIELYSAKYYATCTLGGLLACVSLLEIA